MNIFWIMSTSMKRDSIKNKASSSIDLACAFFSFFALSSAHFCDFFSFSCDTSSFSWLTEIFNSASWSILSFFWSVFLRTWLLKKVTSLKLSCMRLVVECIFSVLVSLFSVDSSFSLATLILHFYRGTLRAPPSKT